jgi:hypothetical protein
MCPLIGKRRALWLIINLVVRHALRASQCNVFFKVEPTAACGILRLRDFGVLPCSTQLLLEAGKVMARQIRRSMKEPSGGHYAHSWIKARHPGSARHAGGVEVVLC